MGKKARFLTLSTGLYVETLQYTSRWVALHNVRQSSSLEQLACRVFLWFASLHPRYVFVRGSEDEFYLITVYV